MRTLCTSFTVWWTRLRTSRQKRACVRIRCEHCWPRCCRARALLMLRNLALTPAKRKAWTKETLALNVAHLTDRQDCSRQNTHNNDRVPLYIRFRKATYQKLVHIFSEYISMRMSARYPREIHERRWKTFRKTFLSLGDSWKTLHPKEKKQLILLFFLIDNIFHELPKETYVFLNVFHEHIC